MGQSKGGVASAFARGRTEGPVLADDLFGLSQPPCKNGIMFAFVVLHGKY